MQAYFSIIQSTALFNGIDDKSLERLLSCLNGRVETYKKNEIMLLQGQEVTDISIILSGKITVLKEDLLGNRFIIDTFSEGSMIKETLCLAKVKSSPVTAMAETDAKVFTLEGISLLNVCGKSCENLCGSCSRLMENLIYVLSQKNIYMQDKLTILSKKTIREKILSYLDMMKAKDNPYITIPLNREQFADYLGVDRSSLSRELSKLQAEGVISYYKNRFRILV